jgi:hypothetical protein
MTESVQVRLKQSARDARTKKTKDAAHVLVTLPHREEIVWYQRWRAATIP